MSYNLGLEMPQKKSCAQLGLSLYIALIALFHLFAQEADKRGLDHLYKMAQFPQIAAILNNVGFETLSTQDKLLYVECLARSGQRREAERLLQKIPKEQAQSFQAHLTAGIVLISRGQFMGAEYHLKQALFLDPENPKAKMARLMLDLYLQDHREAQKKHEDVMETNSEWAESYLFHLLGIEVYGAAGNITKIADLYKTQADIFKKVDNQQHQNFQKNFRLYKREANKTAFQVTTTSDKVTLPFARLTEKDNFAAVSFKIKNNPYMVLLDTGNRVGWTIHSREMEKRLKHRSGGTVLTQIGAEEEMLHGHLLITRQIDFRDFTLQNLPGMYVPKPRSVYPDANLNPLFIKDRVVTLDFIQKQMILRTEEKFKDDLAQTSQNTEKAVTLPWYGYEQVFVPAVVNNEHKALAMLETGAEDITVNLDFARQHKLALEPAIKYLPTGKEFLYHKTPLQISIGHLHFQREETDVWFFERMADSLTGLMPDALLGPDLFWERFALTFDPYQKKILITEFSF
jgi:hypothetical protein